MPNTLLTTVRSVLDELAIGPSTRLRVAYSGGMDSTVLVEVLATLQPALGYSLSLMHVHHGLLPEADDWARVCRDHAARLNLPFDCIRLGLTPPFEGGVEAVARQHRYAALSQPGADLVAVAHHADDQVESVLLQWIRGAGPAGLLGMGRHETSELHPLGIPLVRPFLGVSRALIAAYAKAHKLVYVEDPSNTGVERDRNYLRQAILPALKQRFPGLLSGVERSQRWIKEAHSLLQDLADLDRKSLSAPRAEDPACLPGRVAEYRQLGSVRCRNLLRQILAGRGVRPPPSEQFEEWLRQVFEALPDRTPEVIWSEGVLRRWRDSLWLEPRLKREQGPYEYPLTACSGRMHLSSGGQLWVLEDARAVSQLKQPGDLGLAGRLVQGADYRVAPVTGENRIRPGWQRPHRSVRQLCQENGIPPWRRADLPGLWVGERLIAVPGLGLDPDFEAKPADGGWSVLWRDRAVM